MLADAVAVFVHTTCPLTLLCCTFQFTSVTQGSSVLTLLQADIRGWREQLETDHAALVAYIHKNKAKCGPEAIQMAAVGLTQYLNAGG